MTDAAVVVEALGMRTHPEGGWYVETWRAAALPGERPSGSAILYLLGPGDRSHWHRLDADEVWQYSGGDALELKVWSTGEPVITTHRLGPEVAGDSTVQAVVPRRVRGRRQARSARGRWSPAS